MLLNGLLEWHRESALIVHISDQAAAVAEGAKKEIALLERCKKYIETSSSELKEINASQLDHFKFLFSGDYQEFLNIKTKNMEQAENLLEELKKKFDCARPDDSLLAVYSQQS